jgi:hypothetical protein
VPMPTILRGEDDREVEGPTSRLKGRDVASRPPTELATDERNSELLRGENRDVKMLKTGPIAGPIALL